MDDFEEVDGSEESTSGEAADDSGGPYVCPTCSREFSKPGTCPEHGEELLPEQELNG